LITSLAVPYNNCTFLSSRQTADVYLLNNGFVVGVVNQ